jgi:superoxide dismutase
MKEIRHYITAIYLTLIAVFCVSCESPRQNQSQSDIVRLLPDLQQWYSRLSEAEMASWKKVATYFVGLMTDGKLPGLSKEDHGQANGYALTKEFRQAFGGSELINNKMIADADSCEGDSYLFYVTTKESKSLCYILCLKKDGSFALVSSFHFTDGQWVRL